MVQRAVPDVVVHDGEDVDGGVAPERGVALRVGDAADCGRVEADGLRAGRARLFAERRRDAGEESEAAGDDVARAREILGVPGGGEDAALAEPGAEEHRDAAHGESARPFAHEVAVPGADHLEAGVRRFAAGDEKRAAVVADAVRPGRDAGQLFAALRDADRDGIDIAAAVAVLVAHEGQDVEMLGIVVQEQRASGARAEVPAAAANPVLQRGAAFFSERAALEVAVAAGHDEDVEARQRAVPDGRAVEPDGLDLRRGLQKPDPRGPAVGPGTLVDVQPCGKHFKSV